MDADTRLLIQVAADTQAGRITREEAKRLTAHIERPKVTDEDCTAQMHAERELEHMEIQELSLDSYERGDEERWLDEVWTQRSYGD